MSNFLNVFLWKANDQEKISIMPKKKKFIARCTNLELKQYLKSIL